MKIRFYHARILSMQEPICIKMGEVWTDENRISKVIFESSHENSQNTNTPVFDREIDCQGNLLMPGFKNAHTHSPMVLFRSMADDEPLQGWLENLIFPIEAKLTEKDTYELAKLAVLEYLTSGVTAIFDMYLTPLSTAKAYEECGMRNVQVSGLNNFVISPKQMEEYYLTLNQPDSLSSYHMGVHAEYTCSLDLLEQVAELVQKYKAPFFTHSCETNKEVLDCKNRYGKTPIELMCDLGLYEYGGGGYHCIYVNEHDLELMQEKKLTVVTNPSSNLKLASGIAPISKYLSRKIPVAIGTDGAGSNNCLDLFREMFLVSGLAKYYDQDATSVDAIEVLKMATVNGAKAMGLDDCDTIDIGKKADLILLDLNQPNMQPMNHIVKNIVYSGSKQNVKLTMINGQILYENGSFYLPFEPEEIYAKANEICNRVR